MRSGLRRLLFSLTLPLSVVTSQVRTSDAVAGADDARPETLEFSGALCESTLAPIQIELLELAFTAASKMPADPHQKNRARAQDVVVEACLELDQPRRALGFIHAIQNWRRGAGYADLAYWSATRSATESAAVVSRLLELAADVADHPSEANPQEWQRDRIRVKIARTYALLGDDARATEFEAGAVEAELGKVAEVQAMRHDPGVFEKHLAAVDDAIAAGSFDRTRAAIDACAELFAAFYADRERREAIDAKLDASWARVPVDVRIGVMLRLAGVAVDAGDAVGALARISAIKAIADGCAQTPDFTVPLAARLAVLRHRAGEASKARQDIDAALARFDAARERIVDIRRAGLLRPLAEAYQSIGDPASALYVCKRAIDEGEVNPNSRPRADDLVATCCLMARLAIDPDETLRIRIRQIHDALGEPW